MYTLCFGIVYALFVVFFFGQGIVSLYALLQLNHLDGLQVLCLQGIMYAILRLIKALSSTTFVHHAHTTHARLQAVSQA
jgi:hypothetical protein